ncbi:hypothetical protein GRF29_216g1220640 [Pseudopithomyces chartarum]|uniref:Uncharacterized protein n=1 Tax=Pseudopithomyces chartarum TaxID=1892770 RepID=A0AAN6LLZ5_9PLEO|nr:hypothetical protein GRF29_216g1220640 [Pseudopithomyces chartarum]
MRFVLALSTLIAAVVAAPVAAPADGRQPAPPVGSACKCGTAPNIVYSQCFDKPEGGTVIYICTGSCTWLSTGSGC